MVKISVVIPTYNYGRFIGEAIEGVLRQTLAPSEIIVVDDGSTDETADVVAGFGELVRYIRQENAGVCVARNRGVAESSGELIAFLDADDIWERTKLEKQAAKFTDNPEIGFVHSGMREFDSETGRTIANHLEGLEGWVAEELLLWERPVIVGPGGIMVSRDAFENAGGFDPRMKCGEDWDLCYRIARKYPVALVREPLVQYRSHLNAAHLNVREMERGMSLFYEKAFAEGSSVLQLQRRALGNFRRVLAGSYFRAGMYVDFVRNAVLSIWYRPSGIGYFAAFPLRRFSKQHG